MSGARFVLIRVLSVMPGILWGVRTERALGEVPWRAHPPVEPVTVVGCGDGGACVRRRSSGRVLVGGGRGSAV